MKSDRRNFLATTSSVTAGFLGLRALNARAAQPESAEFGYGPLLADPNGLFSLPQGFTYRIISRQKSVMDDGFFVPGDPDGMAAFPGPDGLTVVIRNHECNPEAEGPFGTDRELAKSLDTSRFYDAGEGTTACAGGTTTIVYDTRNQRMVRQFLSLAGTMRNCAGGPTPWNSWISCEETGDRAGFYEKTNVALEKDHGYNFEVPVTHEIALADPSPLVEMGRFRHEAVAVDEATSIVYQTEDLEDGLIYRFLPNTPGKLSDGGQLQFLQIKDRRSCDTRNWEDQKIRPGEPLTVQWRNIDNPESPDDDLRYRGFEAGAARFARGEGMWQGSNREIYIAATNGGKSRKGQIWKYTPCKQEGQEGDGDSGTLELFLESHKPGVVENADNLTVAPWGDLVVCEDRTGDIVRLIGVTPKGEQYPLAFNHSDAELAGVCFSPDGTTLLVNIQKRGLTLAVTGPWRSDRA